jgi:hypothetical protein
VNRRRPSVLQITRAKISTTADHATAAHAITGDPIEQDQDVDSIGQRARESRPTGRNVLNVGLASVRIDPASVVVATNDATSTAGTSIVDL